MATTKPATPAPVKPPLSITIFRDAAGTYGLYTKYFGAGDNLGPDDVASDLLKIAAATGLVIPKDVIITQDAFKVAMAGGAIVDDIEEGAQVLEVVGDLAGGVTAVGALLNALGVLPEPAKQLVDFAQLMGCAALVISSCGLNILADIGFVMATIACAFDLAKDFTGDKKVAIAKAKQDLQKNVNNFVQGEISYASAQAKAYLSGNLDYWDFVGNIALNSPLEFPGFFPGLKAFFPSTVTVHITGSGESKGWFSSQTDTESTDITEMYTTESQIQAVLLKKYILEPMSNFSQYFRTGPTISIHAMSLLSMLLSTSTKGPVEMDFDFDIVSAMQMLGITPSMLGDTWVFKGFMRQELELADWEETLPYPLMTLKQPTRVIAGGVVINGVPQYTAEEQSEKKYFDQVVLYQRYMQHLDSIGDIDTLMTFPEARALLKRWANVLIDPTFDANWKVTNMDLKPGCQPVASQPWFNPRTLATEPRFVPYLRANYSVDISDYWKCLSTIASMQKSRILNDAADALAQQYESFDSLISKFQKLYGFVIAKHTNLAARANIASRMGIPLSQLGTRKGRDGNVVFYKKSR